MLAASAGAARQRRSARITLGRVAHQLDGAYAGIDDVLQVGFRALVGHAAVAVSDDADLHAVEQGIRLAGCHQRCRGDRRQRGLSKLSSRVMHRRDPPIETEWEGTTFWASAL